MLDKTYHQSNRIFFSLANLWVMLSHRFIFAVKLNSTYSGLNGELMEFLFSHEINQGIRNQQILDEGNGFSWKFIFGS